MKVLWLDSPYINRFLQPDAIVPNSANPQSWNRYSYVRNNPVMSVDPTGHDDVPWWEALKYVASQLLQNGTIKDSDWVNAANIYMPAAHQGTNFSAVVSGGALVGGVVGGVVVEANAITIKNGEFQMFVSGGVGLASTQAALGYSVGVIEGKNFRNTSDFGGYYVQGTLGGNSPLLIGASVDGWTGLAVEKGKNPKLAGVWGYDVGVSLGTPGPSGSLIFGKAIPANEAVDWALKKMKLYETGFGQGYSRYAEKVNHFQLSGFGLFVCRAVNQCGRGRAK